jgi:hypothetical protein
MPAMIETWPVSAWRHVSALLQGLQPLLDSVQAESKIAR